MRTLLLSLLLIISAPASADTLVATRTIRAQSVLAPADLALVPGTRPGTLSDPADAIGREARITLYAGRAIRVDSLGAPAIIERNQIIPLTYETARITILTEGRALARGGIGDAIRVMNQASRSTVSGRIRSDGSVVVGPTP